MPSPDEFSEQHERATRRMEVRHYKPGSIEDQAMLDYLVDAGFQWDEAVTLLTMRENLYENAEMRQRMVDDHRMHFVKWLYEHGLVSEE